MRRPSKNTLYHRSFLPALFHNCTTRVATLSTNARSCSTKIMVGENSHSRRSIWIRDNTSTKLSGSSQTYTCARSQRLFARSTFFFCPLLKSSMGFSNWVPRKAELAQDGLEEAFVDSRLRGKAGQAAGAEGPSAVARWTEPVRRHGAACRMRDGLAENQFQYAGFSGAVAAEQGQRSPRSRLKSSPSSTGFSP